MSEIRCNPHLGKPAYITATNACEIVKSPCEIDIGAPIELISEIEDSLITPDCMSVVDVSNPGRRALEFQFDNATGQYSGDGTIIYDRVLGWIAEINGTSYRPSSVSDNVSNTYCNTEGDILAIVPCDKSGTAFFAPACLGAICSTNPAVPAGNYTSNGDNTYSPETPEQGSLVFSRSGGWTISADGQIYQGPNSSALEPEGVYTAPDETYIALSAAACGINDIDPDAPNRPSCINMVFASNSLEVTPVEFNYNEDTDSYSGPSGQTIVRNGETWTLTTPNGVLVTEACNSPVTTYSDGTNSATFVGCESASGAFLPSCVQSEFSNNANVILGEFTRLNNRNYTSGIGEQGIITYTDRWRIAVTINGNTVQYLGSSDSNGVVGAYTSNTGATILITECN